MYSTEPHTPPGSPERLSLAPQPAVMHPTGLQHSTASARDQRHNQNRPDRFYQSKYEHSTQNTIQHTIAEQRNEILKSCGYQCLMWSSTSSLDLGEFSTLPLCLLRSISHCTHSIIIRSLTFRRRTTTGELCVYLNENGGKMVWQEVNSGVLTVTSVFLSSIRQSDATWCSSNRRDTKHSSNNNSILGPERKTITANRVECIE